MALTSQGNRSGWGVPGARQQQILVNPLRALFSVVYHAESMRRSLKSNPTITIGSDYLLDKYGDFLFGVAKFDVFRNVGQQVGEPAAGMLP
jgi:hypothetical protein